MKFSVLMSVYEKEKAVNLEKALQSVLIEQTVIPNQVVIVEDGELTTELYEVIQKYKDMFPELLDIVQLKRNFGLGKALNEGMKHCRYELIARMDSDDISSKERFEKQLQFFTQHPQIAICGGNIVEFYEEPSNIISIRAVPEKHNKIVQRMKFRNPMNHVSVMMRKEAVEMAGGYKSLSFLEDYYLWIRLVEKGFLLENISDILVRVRTGTNMFERRGNKIQIKGWYTLQKKMKKMNILTGWEFIRNMICIIGFTYCPTIVKKIIYECILREKWDLNEQKHNI